MLHYRLFKSAGGAVLCALASLSSVNAAQRIQQLAEDGVTTRYVQSSSTTAAPLTQVCEAGAKWLRVSLRELYLAPYDSLTLISSSGERYTFVGKHWNEQLGVAARALRGECVSFQPSFGSSASKYTVESYQFGTQELATTSVVVAGAGDICDSGSGNACQGTSDAIVAINPTAVFTAGDNVYDNGTLAEYNDRYEPSWGRFKDLTKPTPGNHDYNTAKAQGYFDYFNGANTQIGIAGDRSLGYYSWNVGDWHFIALNTMLGNTLDLDQLRWLELDLAANTKPCTAAYWHHPLVTRGAYKSYQYPLVQSFWEKLYAARADLVLVGHDHNYQRYGLMNPSQVADDNGIRQVLVGTGGRTFYSTDKNHPLLEVTDSTTWGVLKLTLTATGYTGDFVRSAAARNGTFKDNFSGTCHNAGVNQPPVADYSFTTSTLTAKFTDKSTDANGAIAAHSWNFGDGTTSIETSPSHTYATAGTYSVALTVTDNGGVTHTVTQSVTVASSNQAPVAKFSFTTSGLTATFTNSSTDIDGSIASRSWSFGDSSTSTELHPSHAYTAAGNYSVALKVTDNFGATHTVTQSVTVTAPPACAGTTYTNTFSGANGQTQWVMLGATPDYYQTTATALHTICASGPAGTNFDIYLQKSNMVDWNTTVASSTGTSSTEVINYTGAAGYYAVKIINTSGTGTWTVTIGTRASTNQAPVASYSFTTSGLTANFTDSSTDNEGPIASRSWNFGDGSTATATATNPSHAYTAAGTYNVALTVTDNAGATHTVTKSVTVTAPSACAGTSYTNTFSGASGQTQWVPAGGAPGSYYYEAMASGVHSICASGPAGTNFDVYLQKWNGVDWTTTVARSTGTSSTETINYTGTAGFYAVKIINTSGTGTWNLTLQHP